MLSMSVLVLGCTDRSFLHNIEEIVTQSLPEENLKKFFKNKDVAQIFLMNQITFYEEMVQVHFAVVNHF